MTNSPDNTISRLTRLETKVDAIQESIPVVIERRREENKELKAEITQLRETIIRMNECIAGLTKEMKFASETIQRDIISLKGDNEKIKGELDKMRIKIIQYSAAASMVFVLIGPKILHLVGMG